MHRCKRRIRIPDIGDLGQNMHNVQDWTGLTFDWTKYASTLLNRWTSENKLRFTITPALSNVRTLEINLLRSKHVRVLDKRVHPLNRAHMPVLRRRLNKQTIS
jgi:hypothetical protein